MLNFLIVALKLRSSTNYLISSKAAFLNVIVESVNENNHDIIRSCGADSIHKQECLR